ncbi:MAG: MFS transporter [Gaiellaceae bacterium]
MNPNDPTTGAAVAPAPRRLVRFPAVLQGRDFRRFWAGETVSLLGDQITMIALPLVGVLALDASAAEMGYLGAAGLFPALLFSLHAGAWVDRRGRRRQTMIFTALGRAVLIATLPLAYAFDALTLTQLYVVSFLIGTLSVVFFVAYSTLFVSLVPREQYVEANSLLNGSRALSYVAGPSIGGLLVQVFSAPGALIADACSFLASAFAMSSISPVEPPTERAERGHIKAGVRYMWGSPIIRASLLATATINFFNFVFWALFVLYVSRELDVPAGTLGLILGAGAVGGVIGSLVTGRISRRIGLGPAYVVGCVLFPLPLLLVPLASGPRWVVVLMLFLAEFWSGVGVMMLDISAGSIFAALIPDRLRSRVSGAYSFVNYGVRPLGSLAGGVLGSTIGLQPTLWIGAIGALAGVLWLLPSPIPRLRDLPEPEDADGPVLADQHA